MNRDNDHVHPDDHEEPQGHRSAEVFEETEHAAASHHERFEGAEREIFESDDGPEEAAAPSKTHQVAPEPLDTSATPTPGQERPDPAEEQQVVQVGEHQAISDSEEVEDEPDESDFAAEDVDEEEESAAGAAGPRVIECGPGRLRAGQEAALQVLAGAGCYFATNHGIVRVQQDPGMGQARVVRLSPDDLRVELDDLIEWQVTTSRGTTRRCEVPSSVVNSLTKGSNLLGLKRLKGLAHQPFLRPDGTLCDQAGYDESTGVYAQFDPCDFKVSAAPSSSQVDDALTLLDELLEEFPFASDDDRHAALAAMLTAVARPSLECAPMILVSAPHPDGGKTYLCRLLAAFASPAPSAPIAYPRDNAECEKLMLGLLKSSPPVVMFDNAPQRLRPYESLCAILTHDTYQGRAQGGNKVPAVSTRSLILVNGINVALEADMPRRVLTIGLDTKLSNPHERTFKRDVVKEVRRERGRYVSAALTIVRAWIEAGVPMSMNPIHSFEIWSAWCREPLSWLGLPDPAQTMFRGLDADPDREQLRAFMETVRAIFGTGPFMVHQLFERATELAEAGDLTLRELLIELVGGLAGGARHRMGHWIGRHTLRVIDGHRIMKDPVTRNAQVWRIERV